SSRPRVKSNNYNPPVGRIKEVLKGATKQDIQKVKGAWAQVLGQLQKSQAALLAEAEPVAASSSAFVVKFKYDIHCKMVAENTDFTAMFSQYLYQLTDSKYDLLCIPDEEWFKLREEFIKENHLADKKESTDHDDE
ncbi:hypothetical protein RhiirA1_482964, partial [Rhizophagus irregularis]